MSTNLINKKYLFLFILIPIFYLPCYISNDYLIKYSREDGFYESMGAIFFLLTAFAFFALAIKPSLYQKENGVVGTQERWYFLILGLLFVFACGEEISWGQRILNFTTPASMEEMNMQGEFNIHNIRIFHGKNASGEDKTGFYALLEMNKLFFIAFFIFLFVFPLIYKRNLTIKSFIDKIYIPVPSLLLGILFTYNLIYGHILKMIIGSGQTNLGHFVVEIKESVFAIILFMLPLSWINFKTFKKSKVVE